MNPQTMDEAAAGLAAFMALLLFIGVPMLVGLIVDAPVDSALKLWSAGVSVLVVLGGVIVMFYWFLWLIGWVIIRYV